ncbi:MAG TPA: flagellar hook capping FlgD N-terminal domain-containing protein [Ideonella sp.]|jgi:flagellar basal-body rod modification protein FlgD|nr:flagellar hook capping FlgD N-terminal domain-containing protein [Ideonella sp.]
MSVSGVDNTGNTSQISNTATSASEQSDRFMKLLVAQMQNQDPLNPMDNAQVTTQMAQISTVSGLEKLNTTTAGLNGQFVQLQAMQSAALIGHDVAIEGNTLRVRDGSGDGGFELSSAASNVKVEIQNSAGTTIGTVEMTDAAAGRHDFSYAVPDAYKNSSLTFKVTATNGSTPVEAMALAHQRINAVSTFGDTLALELSNGDRVAYDAVWAFL